MYSPFTCVVLLFALMPCKAQDIPTQPPVDQAKKSAPAPYLLATDDVIGISVINFPNLSLPSVTIPPDGKITVPLLEPFSIFGKTTNEVATELTTKWRRYIINPSVTVTLIQRRKESVLVYGFAAKSGVLQYKQSLHLMEVIAEVGGAAPNGDLTKVTLTRKSGEKRLLDLSHPETRGGSEVDVLIEPDDVIYIPERRTQVSVLGEVNRPGSLDYKENMTILDALSASGGVRDLADLAGASLMHDNKESKIDLEALLRRGDISVNAVLAPGDRILIPEIRNRTYVFGAVHTPGYYNFKPGDRVLDALKACGGPDKEADLKKINVIRIDKDKMKGRIQQVDLDKLLKKGEVVGNIPLEAGDALFVPNKKHGFGLSDLFGMLSGLSLISQAGRLFQ